MFNVTRMVPRYPFARLKLSKMSLLFPRPIFIFTSVWLCEAVENFFSRSLARLLHPPPIQGVCVVNSCRVCQISFSEGGKTLP